MVKKEVEVGGSINGAKKGEEARTLAFLAGIAFTQIWTRPQHNNVAHIQDLFCVQLTELIDFIHQQPCDHVSAQSTSQRRNR